VDQFGFLPPGAILLEAALLPIGQFLKGINTDAKFYQVEHEEDLTAVQFAAKKISLCAVKDGGSRATEKMGMDGRSTRA
jgi:hypothetical protein